MGLQRQYLNVCYWNDVSIVHVAMTPIDKWDCNLRTNTWLPLFTTFISLVAMTPIDKWDCNR